MIARDCFCLSVFFYTLSCEARPCGAFELRGAQRGIPCRAEYLNCGAPGWVYLFRGNEKQVGKGKG